MIKLLIGNEKAFVYTTNTASNHFSDKGFYLWNNLVD